MRDDATLPSETARRAAESEWQALARRVVLSFPQLSAYEQRLALTLYQLLTRGEPVGCARLAQALDFDVDEVDETLGRWTGIYYDNAHDVIGFWGLTVRETPHQFIVGGRTVYAWCALDTLFLPALLDDVVQVTSHCAASGEPVRLMVSPNSIESVAPPAVVVSFLEPDEHKLRENVINHFCHFVHFFRSGADGERWISQHPSTFLLTLDEAFRIAKQLNASRFPDVLRSIGELQS